MANVDGEESSTVDCKFEPDADDYNESEESNAVNESADEKGEKTNLIVNYLPQQMSDAEFENLFKKFGAMKSSKIVRNRVSGYSYGFGFVDFQTHEQALQAIDELNGHELDTKKIKVAFARPTGQDIKQANLYIRNIPDEWTEDDVKKVFEPYGNIIQVRVLGNNRGVAFVLFDLRKQAEDALQALNGKTVMGCNSPLEIKFAADKKVEKSNSRSQSKSRSKSQGQRQNRRKPFPTRQSFGGNNRQGRQPTPRGIGQDQFSIMNNNQNSVGPIRQGPNRMNRYAPFVPVQQPMQAPIAQQMAPNPSFTYPTQQQQMISFSMMPTQPQVLAPANPLQIYGATVGYAPMPQNTISNMYSVASNNLTNAAPMQAPIGQTITMRNNNQGGGGGGGGGGDGVTLFVYNIGPDADEKELKGMFSNYGHVIKCNVVRKNPGGETKGFGFVTLKDNFQANAAIAGLNGTMKNGRALQVSLKK